ncbi:hypothetical protein ANN_21645 [Periplaneta americana]|uniref:Reverse transcriptase domain-containing protein n=1 Tax=Periplaneta americana TaxID=6978 RepID=A0ABQ8S621_PERAM|nr:hypothetical protein ANN_21645 [Periplaneta americana]
MGSLLTWFLLEHTSGVERKKLLPDNETSKGERPKAWESTATLAFADDVAIISRNIKSLSNEFERLNEKAEHMGLTINQEKTKYMFSGYSRISIPNELKIQEFTFERVKSFKYLGSVITENNTMDSEIGARLIAANKNYFGLANILKAKNVPCTIKTKIYKTTIRPVLIYGAETWTLTKREENSLGTFERKILRRIYGAINEGGIWRRRFNRELYHLYEESDI